MEERRHRRRHRPGQGHQPRPAAARVPGARRERRRDAVLHGHDGVTGGSCGRATAPPAGTVLVKDIRPGRARLPGPLTNVGGTLFFTADDGGNGVGAVEERRHRGRHRPGQGHPPRHRRLPPTHQPDERQRARCSSRPTTAHGRELWKSDGTAAGTVLVKDINPGTSGARTAGPEPDERRATLFFTANDGGHARASCGRATAPPPGTVLVKDINPGTAGSDPRSNLTRVNGGTLFFTRQRRGARPELWKSDGTAAGTVLVKDINPGVGGRRALADGGGRHAVLHGRRRHATARAVEERRHRRRHRPGQGHQPRHPRLRPPGPTRLPDQRERHAVLHGRRRRDGRSCGRATAPPPAPSWSRTSTRQRRLVPSPT